MTIEDPVEYQLPRVAQIEVRPKSGLTFARGLRMMLRSDPDVLLVGEIRDEETARIAIQAAMTGHLVLTSLHTHNAASSIERLKDMGVELPAPAIAAGSRSTRSCPCRDVCGASCARR
jgi:type II secretory ATPase GspE/PulE/Tfp pilus assembly ATPase PilB-like protein